MNKYVLIVLLTVTAGASAAYGQQKKAYTPSIEPCACAIAIDSTYATRCGYLLVPENRKKAGARTVKLPFIMLLSKHPNKKKDPLLFTAGGPGGSSLGWAVNMTKHTYINDRDCIAFEQRGTRFAIPNLWSAELSEAIQESYRKNLPKDSMVLEGVKRLKKSLLAKGIDLAGYNTDETVADIADLLTVLHIDSVNLLGGSYSGGLMLAVLQKVPQRVRSLVLDSPLPTFIPIDEDEPANFNEALNTLFRYCARDSADTALYGNLKQRFQTYFTAIGGKSFYIDYVEKNKTDTLHIQYTRNDLLNVIENALFNPSRIKDVPFIITELINGRHQPYIKPLLDDIFQGTGPSGMRLSVYCADQAAYNRERVMQQLPQAYPWMEGYHINDVYKAMCDCWQVPPIAPQTKQPFYSDKPVLLADGALDPACRPLYMDMIHHYMPNSRCFLFTLQSHMAFRGEQSEAIIHAFLDNPYAPININDRNIIAY